MIAKNRICLHSFASEQTVEYRNLQKARITRLLASVLLLLPFHLQPVISVIIIILFKLVTRVDELHLFGMLKKTVWTVRTILLFRLLFAPAEVV